MKVLVANRGEIAVRLIKSCQSLGFHTTAIYSEEDGGSLPVRMADEAVGLEESGVRGYLNSRLIVDICKDRGIHIVLPGYGFLSENAQFAQLLQESGIVFGGPSPDTITEFGLKHRARELAIKAGVPVLPGTAIIKTKDEAAVEADRLGYPVMVKATAGGGGMGLVVCRSPDDLGAAIDNVRSRVAALFKDSGLFLEKYIESARHIEGQIFGNGQGDIAWFGERECSIQRRHQKVLEETPSPFVLQHQDLRERLRAASVALAESVKYKSVGTVEFLVNNDDGELYFLEMNTRLQVEHGVTELCYDIDLVRLMLLQAQAEVSGLSGIDSTELARLGTRSPSGHAIEVRVYAENPADDHKPAPGLFTDVFFPNGDGVRVDSWLQRGSRVTPFFDPLLAKVMTHSSSRDGAFALMESTLASTTLHGPPTNLEFLRAILESSDVSSGYTLTNTLERFVFESYVMEFIDGGLYTTVQDYPGRPNRRSGVPVSGPMDNVSFRVANMLVGNDEGVEGFEITYAGPTVTFRQDAVIALCGARFDFSINGNPAKMWARHVIKKGSIIAIGSHTSAGCRAYLAVLGGLPNVGTYLGSKSTTPTLQWGGYQGRTLRAGDVLQMDRDSSRQAQVTRPYNLPDFLIPTAMDTTQSVYVLPGPYDTDEFVTAQGRENFFGTVWKVAFSSSRGGLRLEGPAPEWSRESGGEGGSHPSNVLGYGYPLGGLSFTGDSAVVFTADSPVQSGFISLQTVLSCELWKLGQLKPGDEVRFLQCSWEQALEFEGQLKDSLQHAMDAIERLDDASAGLSGREAANRTIPSPIPGRSVLYERAEGAAAPGGDSNRLPRFVVRQAGDRGLLCDFGSQVFDLNTRVRIQQLVRSIADGPPPGLERVSRPHTMSVFVAFDPAIINQSTATELLVKLESSLSGMPSLRGQKTYHLPMIFDAEENDRATKRYMETQRPYATYLPDNIDFMRRNNGLSARDDVRRAVENIPFLVLASSGLMGLPIMIQVDPLKRLIVPKSNPSRTSTPAGALGTGGTTSCIYPVESPGGYLLWGLTLSGCPFDTFGCKPNYTPDRPWLFEPFDQIVFKGVTRREFDTINRKFQMGMHKIEAYDSTFDMADYNDLVDRTRDEVREIRKKQQAGADVEGKRESELIEQWEAEKKAQAKTNGRCDNDIASTTQLDPKHIRVSANLNAKAWKIKVNAGSVVEPGDELLILEAMKMEISVKAPGERSAYTVVSVMKKEGDLVEPGDVLFALDPNTSDKDVHVDIDAAN